MNGKFSEILSVKSTNRPRDYSSTLHSSLQHQECKKFTHIQTHFYTHNTNKFRLQKKKKKKKLFEFLKITTSECYETWWHFWN